MKDLVLRFEKEVYAPGEQVHGSVTLSLTKPLQATSLEIFPFGVEHFIVGVVNYTPCIYKYFFSPVDAGTAELPAQACGYAREHLVPPCANSAVVLRQTTVTSYYDIVVRTVMVMPVSSDELDAKNWLWRFEFHLPARTPPSWINSSPDSFVAGPFSNCLEVV